MLSKKQKTLIINYLLSSLYNIGLSSKSIGHLLRALHFSIPLVCMFFILQNNWYLNIVGMIIVLGSILAFILFQGCFMTKIESILLDDGFTVVDPMLEFLGFEITYDSRYYITVVMGGLYALIFIAIVCAKFLLKDVLISFE
jgi:hypothetical protein